MGTREPPLVCLGTNFCASRGGAPWNFCFGSVVLGLQTEG